MNTKDVRALFLEYFANKGHKIYDSMPLVPDDPTLLFTNAGMVQFKDIFTGRIPIPTPNIATSAQTCIRAGGKHNDLENVGYTARHHTLFEMLGNFSFGAYFKKEAIAYAWEFVTEVLGFDKKVLYVTVHENDTEAYELWSAHIDASRIKKMGDKDNFWQMGDVGPCGPCSEIFVDQGEENFNGPEDYFGGDGDRFLEIWNLVFMQFERDKEGNLKPLPKPSIDTGMGLERVVALLEGKRSNFDSSLFMPLIAKVEEITKQTYVYESGASFRVIADHARSVAFLLAQGVNFDKEGRGYVLRRILRRAIRHGYLLGLRAPFVYEVVGRVCENMGAHYQYLLEKQQTIMTQCKAEEVRFFETIENGMNLFNKELEKLKQEKANQLFSGEVAFRLYDTYGFPLDLTQDMLRENGFGVDMDSFEICMKAQKEQAKANWKGSGDSAKEGDFKILLSEFGQNEFVGYEKMESQSRILALLDSNLQRTEAIKAGEMGFVMLDITPFYPESGGPVGDKGILKHNQEIIAEVIDTKKYFGLNISQVQAIGNLRIQEGVFAVVDSARLEIAKHHSATHLLHKALREVLGEHIAQAGSLVESNRLRFDFSHPSALSPEELERIEQNVNAQILSANAQVCEQMELQKAKAKGAIALFGEKYGKEVRVVSFGDSVELCGGIHVPNTAYIGSFYIIKESGVSSGVRRIEAVCGKAAYEWGKTALLSVESAKESLKAQNLLQGIEKLKEQVRELKSKANKSTSNLKEAESESIQGVKLIVSELKDIEASEAKKLVDNAKNENEKVAVLLLTTESQKDKIVITAGVKGIDLKAGLWVKEIAQILGGNGGGRDDFATAGGKDKAKIPQALQAAKEIAKKAIG
ncbi:alanine--tRNA ligase [Helicobacter sp. MIT 05-5294]|uniref:alanine--tRNA ligase n=1 Tax=Helicobacter sp. MIT 05-5294 TaxID=1548150 RepID=UPI0010FCEAB2|nr:alanine--tRNA ligase [Helicobacter sp. MIT 05-5294]TLD87572.1 alanine--tRNA ligase [Helicobacter sp. MIT 05-5294]